MNLISYLPAKLTSFPSFRCNNAMFVNLALEYFIIFGLNWSSEESSTRCTNLKPKIFNFQNILLRSSNLSSIIRMFSGLFSTHVTHVFLSVFLGRDFKILKYISVFFIGIILCCVHNNWSKSVLWNDIGNRNCGEIYGVILIGVGSWMLTFHLDWFHCLK